LRSSGGSDAQTGRFKGGSGNEGKRRRVLLKWGGHTGSGGAERGPAGDTPSVKKRVLKSFLKPLGDENASAKKEEGERKILDCRPQKGKTLRLKWATI